MDKNGVERLRAFRKKALHNKRRFRRFLSALEKTPPRGLDRVAVAIEKIVWGEVDCLSCGNCCKTMTPTYTLKDIRRIALHLGMTPAEYRKKWLRKEKSSGDWLNKSTPCQFLDLENNKCSIYPVRPRDCSGFPHLTKRRMVEYIHVHKQNLEFCPATHRMVEKMMELDLKKNII